MKRFFMVTTFAFFIGPFLPSPLLAQACTLPEPGKMVSLSESFTPVVMEGIKVYPDDPFRFEFIIDSGDEDFEAAELEEEASKLIKYFLAALTTPEEDIWVNLSPYEQNRIIPESFGMTEMGRDMLAQDYLLKQITASLLYPDSESGEEFWNKVYDQIKAKNLDVPVESLSKVWIMPESAEIYTSGSVAMIVDSHMKVMTERDYGNRKVLENSAERNQEETQQTKVFKEVIIPLLEKEVNEGKNFAPLRQVYQSLILATWFKKNLRESILNKAYAGKNKIAGVEIDDPSEKEKIYERYVQGYQLGVFNFIKEEYDPRIKQLIPHKYFSGGEYFVGKQMDYAITVKEFEDNLWKKIQEYKKTKRAKSYQVSASLIEEVFGGQKKDKIAEDEKGRLMLDLKHALMTGKVEKIIAIREEVKAQLTQSEIDAIWLRLGPGGMTKEMALFYLDQFYVKESTVGTAVFLGLIHSIIDANKEIQSDFFLELLSRMGDKLFINEYQTMLTFTYPVERVTQKELSSLGFDPKVIFDKLIALQLARLKDKNTLQLVEEFDEKEEILKKEFPDDKERQRLIESLQMKHSLNFLELAAAYGRIDFLQRLLNNGYFDAPRFIDSAIQVAKVSKRSETVSYLESFLQIRKKKQGLISKGVYNEEAFLKENGKALGLEPKEAIAKPQRTVIRRRKKNSVDEPDSTAQEKGEDFAIISNPERVGGIDFNPQNILIKSSGERISFEVNSAVMEELVSTDFAGFSPFIVQISPFNIGDNFNPFFLR